MKGLLQTSEIRCQTSEIRRQKSDIRLKFIIESDLVVGLLNRVFLLS